MWKVEGQRELAQLRQEERSVRERERCRGEEEGTHELLGGGQGRRRGVQVAARKRLTIVVEEREACAVKASARLVDDVASAVDDSLLPLGRELVRKVEVGGRQQADVGRHERRLLELVGGGGHVGPVVDRVEQVGRAKEADVVVEARRRRLRAHLRLLEETICARLGARESQGRAREERKEKGFETDQSHLDIGQGHVLPSRRCCSASNLGDHARHDEHASSPQPCKLGRRDAARAQEPARPLYRPSRSLAIDDGVVDLGVEDGDDLAELEPDLVSCLCARVRRERLRGEVRGQLFRRADLV